MAEPIACSGCHGSGQEEPAQGSRLGRALTILACLALGGLLLWSCL